jgi:ATP-dependent DNA ligase
MHSHFHPALIPSPREICQLAGVYRGKLGEGDWFAQEKIDGWRCLYFKGRDGRKGLYTRNGMPIQGAGHILHRLALMEQAAGHDMFFDGEITIGDSLASTKQWLESGWKSGEEAGTLHLFDCMTQSEWDQGGTDRPLYERLRELDRLTEQSLTLIDDWEWRAGTRGKEPPGPHVLALAWEYMATHEDVADFANRIWSRGGEGAIIKRADAPYTRSRSNEWQKLKRQTFDDLRSHQCQMF